MRSPMTVMVLTVALIGPDVSSAQSLASGLLELGLDAAVAVVPEVALTLTDAPHDPCRYGGRPIKGNPETAMGVTGAVAGAVTGTAITGTVRSGVTGAAVGYAAGKLAARAAEHGRTALSERNRSVCELLMAGKTILRPLATDIGAAFEQTCGVSAAQILADDVTALSRLDGCAKTNANVAAALGDFKVRIYNVNHEVCLSIRRVLQDYDHVAQPGIPSLGVSGTAAGSSYAGLECH